MTLSHPIGFFAIIISTLAAPNPADAAEPATTEPAATEPAATQPAAARTPTAASTVRAGLGEGFSIETADGKQSLRIDALISARATVAHADGEDTVVGGTPRLARPVLRGNLDGPQLTYFLQGELAGSPKLLDLELAYTPIDELSVRAGRVRVPFGRQWISGLNVQMLPDRSVVSDAFRPGRDTGLTLESRPFDGILEARIGAYGEDVDPWPQLVARIAVAPLGPLAYTEDVAQREGPARFAVGLGGTYDKRTPTAQAVDLTTGQILTVSQADTERLAGGVDLGVRAGPCAGFAEAYVDRLDATGAPAVVRAGTFAEIGCFVLPSRLEVGTRFDLIAPDVDQVADGLRRYEIGPGYYWFDGALKVQARYAYTQIIGTATGLPLPQGHAGDLQFVLLI